MAQGPIVIGIELLDEDRDHIIRIGARIVEQFFQPGIQCSMIDLRDLGFQFRNAFVNLRLGVGRFFSHETRVAGVVSPFTFTAPEPLPPSL